MMEMKLKEMVMLMLAQRPITLVLMMINSCSYSTNDLCLLSFRYSIKILVCV